MIKRILILVLCLTMLVGVLAGCKSRTDDDGAYITMFLTDEIYDFDPANAYHNTDAVNVVSLLFEPLFTLTSSGKIQCALAKSYRTFTDGNGNHMEITLRNAKWSNGFSLTAQDCVYAWTRLLAPENGYAAASLLYDIKGARAYNEGLVSELASIKAESTTIVKITFEDTVDVNAFLINLTNIATAPVFSTNIKGNPDWAKKASTLVTNGPFSLKRIVYSVETTENDKGRTVNVTARDDNALDGKGNYRYTDRNGNPTMRSYDVQKISSFILERNKYYMRDLKRDALDKYVTPYRILVDCTMTDEELLEAYQNNQLFYIGSIPLSLRNNEFVSKNAKVSDALSTFVCYLNENAEINGEKIFADVHVRRALSLALDREAIADSVVYAKAATALIGPGIFESGLKGSFRKTGGDLLAASANLTAAQEELAKVDIADFDPANFPFTLRVASYDEVHIAMAKQMAQAWGQLGFDVTVEEVQTIVNNDQRIQAGITSDPDKTVCDDLFTESLQRGTFEAIVFDDNAYAPTAYAMLSSFALRFSGKSTLDENGEPVRYTHITGYNSTAYNDLMEAIYFIPYYSKLESDPDEEIFSDPETNPYMGFGLETLELYETVYQTVGNIYREFNITPTDKSAKWADQKAILLHEAEKLLMDELPVIPVVFNQNAVMINSEISGVKSNYYIPASFAKTKLRNYEDYILVFNQFPNSINWDYFGLSEVPEETTEETTEAK